MHASRLSVALAGCVKTAARSAGGDSMLKKRLLLRMNDSCPSRAARDTPAAFGAMARRSAGAAMRTMGEARSTRQWYRRARHSPQSAPGTLILARFGSMALHFAGVATTQEMAFTQASPSLRTTNDLTRSAAALPTHAPCVQIGFRSAGERGRARTALPTPRLRNGSRPSAAAARTRVGCGERTAQLFAGA